MTFTSTFAAGAGDARSVSLEADPFQAVPCKPLTGTARRRSGPFPLLTALAREAGPIHAPPMSERSTRWAAAVAMGAFVAGMVGVVATGFGTQPECGTGSYALSSLGPWFGVAEVAFLLTIIGVVAFVLLLPGWWGAALLVLVLAEAVAAYLGATLSEAANGCAAWRDRSYGELAAWTAGIVAGIVAAVGMGIAALVIALRGGRKAPGPTPDAPAGTLDAGAYRVQRSEVEGISRGTTVRIALEPEELLVLSAGGGQVRFERRLVTTDLDGETTIVAVDRYLQLELRPLPGTDALALIRALEREEMTDTG